MSATNDEGDHQPETAAFHSAALPSLTQYEQAGARVVVVHGAFDSNSVSLLASALRGAAATHTTIVVDAAEMTFADSTVLNVLLNFHRDLGPHHHLRLARPAPQLTRLLEITATDTVLDVRATLEDATSC
ncbi:STAS domain-containing protein [Streptomyces sp. NPDC051920]|uniref:STAS domain-containing protein n=1 Tax=Streptomyces sp. NPDC051920 TaxID=3155523 RepID=UPI0034362C92